MLLKLIGNQRCLKAVNKFGVRNQIDQCQEELGELIVALNKYKRDPSRTTKEDVLTEIVDCVIMFEQMHYIFQFDEIDIEDKLLEKMQKLDRYLSKGCKK